MAHSEQRLYGPFKGYSGMLLHEIKENGWREDLTWKILKWRFLAVTETSYTVAFYQDCWDIVKEDLFRFFEEFFRGGVVNSTMNHTILYLILKKSESKYVKDFRQINLVSSVYKILAEILANCLREVLSDYFYVTRGFR